MDELIFQQLPYVKSLAWRYGEQHREDAYGEGVLALVRSAAEYDPGRGVKFFSYAKRRIDGGIQDYWRRVGRNNPDRVSNPVRVLCSPCDPANYAEEKERRELLLAAIETLESRQRMVIEIYYLQGHTLETIGRMLGYCEANIIRIRTKALRALGKKCVSLL